MKTNTFSIVELFSISFSDGSKVWCSYNIEYGKHRFDRLCYSYFDKGINMDFIEKIKKIQHKYVASFVEDFCKNNENVVEWKAKNATNF
jgi:hypothetical protein